MQVDQGDCSLCLSFKITSRNKNAIVGELFFMHFDHDYCSFDLKVR